MKVERVVPTVSTLMGNVIERGRETTEDGDVRLTWIIAKGQLIMEATRDDGEVIDQYAVDMLELMGHMIQARRAAHPIVP